MRPPSERRAIQPMSARAQPTRKPSKAEVFDVIVEEILSGDLAPGEPLVERALASRFGLSRTPIRELLKRLESEHLVNSYPNQGVFVRRVTPKDVRDLSQIRLALEPLAAQLAAVNRPDDEVAELYAKFPSESAAEELAPAELIAFGQLLHDAIVKWANNSFLREMYEPIRKHTRLIRSMNRAQRSVELQSYGEHVKILDAILRKSPDQALEAMTKHLRRSTSVSLSLLAEPE